MDKNKIKSFAVWARRNLISAVSERANRIGVTEKKILDAVAVQGGFKLEGNDEIFKLSKTHRDKLVKEVNEKGFEQVMEEVAYTWFNRFMGLRYMEVNEYLPTGIRILSSIIEGKTEPDVLTRVSEVIDELNLNAEYIYELLDSGKTEDREEAYKHILVKQCNELGKIIPQMFEKISDYTELLLPDNLLEEGSVIRKMVEDIEEEDWKEEVEIIGWMYQYYISEKKDEVFAALKKNVKITKENIPAATQLFTPKWIVKYMVENSLGRLWLEKLSVDSEQWAEVSEELKSKWKYYLEEAEQEPEVEEELEKIREEHSKLKPEDIKVLDPCMGSGHILVYAFDVLYEIYKTAGYSEREIPRIILQNNLYGLDIDDRAAQLASFALIMKARHYNRRLFREIEREHLELNLCSIQESNEISEQCVVDSGQLIDYFCKVDGVLNEQLKNDFEYLVNVFTDAKEYGSILEIQKVNFEALKQRLKEIEQEDNLMFGDYRKMLLDELPIIIKQAEIMSRKYEVCVTNPPYLGYSGYGDSLSTYIKENYKDAYNDLFAVFIYKCNEYSNRKIAMITQHSWMFLKSYSELRYYLINERTIESINHLGPRAFEEISGEVVQSSAFIVDKKYYENFNSKFIRLVDYKNSTEKESEYFNNKNYFVANCSNFKDIESYSISYWAEHEMFNLIKKANNLKSFALIHEGLKTRDNERFLRLWYEVGDNLLKEWKMYSKGGGYRKWYGNNEYVIDWKNDGESIKNFKKASGKNFEYYFMPTLTYSALNGYKFSVRYIDKSIFGGGGSGITNIDNNKINYLLGCLNSEIINEFLNLMSSTMNYEVGTIGNIPIIFSENDKENVDAIVKECISISKEDWDSFEISIDFKGNSIIEKGTNITIQEDYEIWSNIANDRYEFIKKLEFDLNKIIRNIYGFKDIAQYDIEEKSITIRKADRERDIKSFISYAVGCMLGRYSIDAEGLIYAGGEFSDKWLVSSEQCKVRKIEKDEDGNVISDSWVDATFLPDSDNVIPITEDEYFEDDIASRFVDFVRTVYGEETLEENLDFIADSIGRKPSETARQAIRRYFIKDFYKDHLKVYQKRPIYWMFESGKNDGFKALVYMHRYNEQTVAKVRTDYLHTLQRKYEAEIQRQQLIVDSEEYTAKDRTAAKKKIAKTAKQIEECREYDQVVAHLANEKKSIDLDDGVKVNYAKFQEIKVINSKGKEVNMNLLVKI